MSAALAIAAFGLACPVGLTATTACAAIRAGINRRQLLPYTTDDGVSLSGSMLDQLPLHSPRRRRWLVLAHHALRDLLGERMTDALGRVPLVLAVADTAAAAPSGVEVLRHELSRQLELPSPIRELHVVVGGSTAGLRAVVAARELIRLRKAESCVVLAADSLIDAHTLEELSRHRRLLTERNPDGFTPGEAAACLLVQGASGRLAPTVGTISGLGSAREPATLDNDVPLRAEGVTRAAAAALAEARLELHDVDFRVSDATGESFWFKEQALLPARLLRRRKVELPLWLTSAELGHTRAAAALSGVVMALAASARDLAPGPLSLVFAGDEDGARVAAVVAAPRRQAAGGAAAGTGCPKK
ncbi:MAG: hypothetical protein JNL82_37635 [Myxococcales bacterium]|nr:hypothetical protein [Myxococcales bacterium]